MTYFFWCAPYPSSDTWAALSTKMANSRRRPTTGAEQRGLASADSPGSSSTGREHRGDLKVRLLRAEAMEALLYGYMYTRGHSATCGLLVGILQWKVSEFRFGGLISASYKLSARKLNQMTSLRSIWNNFTRHLQMLNVKKNKKSCDGSSIYYTEICSG